MQYFINSSEFHMLYIPHMPLLISSLIYFHPENPTQFYIIFTLFYTPFNPIYTAYVGIKILPSMENIKYERMTLLKN